MMDNSLETKKPSLRLSRAEKIQHAFYYLLQLSIVAAAIFAIFQKRWWELFVTLLIFGLTFLPAFLARNLRVMLPIEFDLAAVAFIYASLFLGMLQDFYTMFWWWDGALHTFAGMAAGFAGFLIVYTLYLDRRLVTTPFLLAFFAFSFSMMIAALWEIFEYGVDVSFALNMQESGLGDTMGDLIINAIGATLVSFFGYLHVKYRHYGFRVFNYFVMRFLKNNSHFLKNRQKSAGKSLT